MNTTEFINQFSINQNIPTVLKLSEWAHNHTFLIRVSRIALTVLGTAIAGYAIAFLAINPFTWGAVCLGVLGIITIAVTEIAFSYLEISGVLKNSMTSHAFQPASCKGGRLFYQGDIPILQLDSDDPYQAGKANGYLTAPQALKLSRRVQRLTGMPHPSEINDVLEAIKKQLPLDYISEMEGVADGINQWIDEQWFWNRFEKTNLEEILLGHLIPDSLHFHPKNVKQGINTSKDAQVACTVMVNKNSKSQIIVGRTMDWPTCGRGSDGLIINRRHQKNKYSTIEVGIPGFCGTLTGINREGLTVNMNVCLSGNSADPKGLWGRMPSAFYNRSILENCESVSKGRNYMYNHSPLGPYHLNLADGNEAISIHFFQDTTVRGEGWHTIRELQKTSPLITTNYRYEEKELPSAEMFFSRERQSILANYFRMAERDIAPDKMDMEMITAYAMQLPFVNNPITVHAVEMIPETKKMWVALDNSFAASEPLREVDTEALFQ